jgi:small subunit ribosomal protein S15
MSEEKTEKPNWLKIKPADLEKIVIELANQGKSCAEIGLTLRDQHGIPKSKLIGKKISQILFENKIQARTEKDLVKEKVTGLNTHLAKHSHDKKAKRSLMKNSWVVHKIEKAQLA